MFGPIFRNNSCQLAKVIDTKTCTQIRDYIRRFESTTTRTAQNSICGRSLGGSLASAANALNTGLNNRLNAANSDGANGMTTNGTAAAGDEIFDDSDSQTQQTAAATATTNGYHNRRANRRKKQPKQASKKYCSFYLY